MLLPLALAAAAAILPAALPASAATDAAPTRDIRKIAQAERQAHRGSILKPRATTGAGSFMRDTYPVGTAIGSAVDYARATPARYPYPAMDHRNLPISIWYPAEGFSLSSQDQFWAKARAGHFPLVVFAPGFNADPQTYRVFLHAIAAQGYVVAAPTFPIEGYMAGAAAASRSNTEILNQMYDVSAVITKMQAYAKEPGNFLSWAMDPNKVAVIGHSDGGMTVAGMTMSTSYYDNRIDTAIVMAGAGPYGLNWNKRKVVPLMIEQATQDPYNEASNSDWLFNHVTGNRAYLTVYGSYHEWPLTGDDAVADAVRRSVVSQLNGQLRGFGAPAFWSLLIAGDTPGITSLRFAS